MPLIFDGWTNKRNNFFQILETWNVTLSEFGKISQRSWSWYQYMNNRIFSISNNTILNSSDRSRMFIKRPPSVKLSFCCWKQWSWHTVIMDVFPNREDNCHKHQNSRHAYLSQFQYLRVTFCERATALNLYSFPSVLSVQFQILSSLAFQWGEFSFPFIRAVSFANFTEYWQLLPD